MKRINKTTLLLSTVSLLFTVASCEDVLDQSPYSEISEEQFWQSNGDANAGVAAIYDAMQEHYAQRYFQYGEFRSDNYIVTDAPSEGALELTSNTLQSRSEYCEWTNLYAMISRANFAIEKIPQIIGYDPNLLGEAYALRSFAYFDALRVWGDAPLFTEPIRSPQEELARPAADGETILNEIVLPDMLQAEELITNPDDEFRFSKTSIWAYQASVYMWLNDYAKAKERIDLIVASGKFSLTQTREQWHDLFSNDSGDGESPKIQEGPELILSLFFDNEAGDRSGVYAQFYAGIPSYYISPLVENKWVAAFPIDSLSWIAKYPDPADLPKTFVKDADGNDTDRRLFGDWRYFETREEDEPIGEARVAKWNKSNYSTSLDNTDIVLFRYAGVLLMLAEAENQLDNPARALELVNELRTARQLPNVGEADFLALSQAEREDFILEERQFELFGEAKRFWDLQRTDRAVAVMGPINGQTEPTLKFPYYFPHLQVNPTLKQLPQYQ